MKRILVALALLSMVAVAPAAAGPGDDWPSSEWRKSQQSSNKSQARHRQRPRRVRTVRQRTRTKPRYSRITTGSIARPRIDEEREVRAEAGRECVSTVSVVGDQATTLNGAQAQAEKAWQQQVRFRNGELYSDARNASKITYRCVDSSIRNFANRATEAIGINTQLKRCSMSAQPCRAPSELDKTQ